MELSTEEILKKKILDAQEMVRDYETHSKKFKDVEISNLFKNFAEESGYQARELQEMLKKMENK